MISKKKVALMFCAAMLAVGFIWASAALASDPFIGEIRLVGFNFPPRGFANCDGQLLSISSNTALFALLGTMYGGDGRTTFGLPGLRGRVVVHAGTGPGLTPRRQGQRYGSETTTLAVANLPPHTHTAVLHAQSANGTETSPDGVVLANDPREDQYSTAAPDVSMAAAAISVGNTGSGQSFQISQPSLVLRYVIALQGMFPSRD
ncbi:MAG: tail fiber protein [Desulfobacula sp.]|nr:tail fiber protein [Desulfobacula sp.]